MWNILWYTVKETELVNEVCGVNISQFTKPSKFMFALAETLLNKGYLIALDNYYSSPELFNQLNEFQTDAVGTVKSNRKIFRRTSWEKVEKR